MTTIYTGNTTTTGFVVTADNSGDLVLKTGGSGGTTAATFDGTTQQATFNAPVSQPGAFMFRNKIINGNFDIWQRGTSQTSSGYGSADRWQCINNGSTKTASRQAFDLGQTDVPNNPKYFMRHVVTSVAGAGNYSFLRQTIEGVETLSGRTATVSFWAKADASKNIAVELSQNFGSGGSPSSTVNGIGSQLVALTTSWTKYAITISIPSISGKTLGTSANDSLILDFWFDAGSNYDARTDSLGQQSGTFDIAQVQVEEGSAATPFEMRPIGMEMPMCLRYYARFNITIQSPAAGNMAFPLSFSVPMRTYPSITNISGNSVNISAYVLSLTGSFTNIVPRVTATFANGYRDGWVIACDAEL